MHSTEPPVTQHPPDRPQRSTQMPGAAVSGASFVSDGRAGASMAMAVLTGAAFLCYLGNLFAVPSPTTASQGGRDD